MLPAPRLAVDRTAILRPVPETEDRPASPLEDPLSLRPGAIARRTAGGVRRRANWIQLLKFGSVGGTGYVVNLIVFVLLAEVLGIHHLIAAVGAFCVAVTNNFLLNRHWTFAAGAGSTGFQAPRFFAISIGSLLINLVALEVLVSGAGLDPLPAQALAVAIAMPFNFIGNKLWTFNWGSLEE
jgi:putative flippase GtrA